MQTTQRAKLDTFHRVLEFVSSGRPTLADVPPGYPVQVRALQNAVDAITTAAKDRGSGSPAYATTQRRALRQRLLGQLVRIRRVARVLGQEMVGAPSLVNIPRKLKSEQALLDAARAAARDVAPVADRFIDKGLPIDFLGVLAASAQAIERARTDLMAATRRRASARGALQQALRTGSAAVICIDGIVRHACTDDLIHGQSTLEAWNDIVPPRGRAARKAAVAAVVIAGDA